MKTTLYSKIAISNLIKNKRIYIPRILAEIGLLGMSYIMITLAMDDRLSKIKGGAYIPILMGMGSAVLGILSIIIMFYLNSFLMKQRKREFGVYNILGMEKRHVNKVLFYESLYTTLSSVIFGIGFGVLFYKLSSLLICKLLQTQVVAGFYYITPLTVLPAPLFFILTDSVIYIVNRVSINRLKPVDLLNSNRSGEKEPKVKWAILLLGILTLGAGYYIALTTESPLQAMYLFFIAVVLVIIGTYCLFVTGVTFILKTLKKNEKYYYNKKRMPSISGLLYRMKQNAMGLASISILATGVLVMISTTVSLYVGMQAVIENNFPNQVYVNSYYKETGKADITNLGEELLTEIAESSAKKYDIKIKDIKFEKYLETAYLYSDNQFVCESQSKEISDYSKLAMFTFVTQDFAKQNGMTDIDLKKGEALICPLTTTTKQYTSEEITISGLTFKVKGNIPTFPMVKGTLASISDNYGVIVANEEDFESLYKSQKEKYKDAASDITERLGINFEDETDTNEKMTDFFSEMRTQQLNYINSLKTDIEYDNIIFDDMWSTKDNVKGLYGTFFFLGILLGLVCMFATTLIIYYKQISEGYEDRSRFQIMKKVGMSSKEVKKTINSQLLLQFFLPLIVAAAHITVAYPIILKLLHIMLLCDDSLFLICTLSVYAVFCVVYVIIYRLTSKTYYKIVH